MKTDKSQALLNLEWATAQLRHLHATDTGTKPAIDRVIMSLEASALSLAQVEQARDEALKIVKLAHEYKRAVVALSSTDYTNGSVGRQFIENREARTYHDLLAALPDEETQP